MTDHRTLEAKILAMYLGQKAIAGTKEKTFTIIGVCSDSNSCSIKLTGRKGAIINEGVSISIVKPILRKLSDMTEEEAIELAKNSGEIDGKILRANVERRFIQYEFVLNGSNEIESTYWVFNRMSAPMFNYLRSIGIDCDGLIDSGLAIAQKGEGE